MCLLALAQVLGFLQLESLLLLSVLCHSKTGHDWDDLISDGLDASLIGNGGIIWLADIELQIDVLVRRLLFLRVARGDLRSCKL